MMKQATDDYTNAIIHHDPLLRTDCEHFFRSEYFGMLCWLDPEALMEKAQRIAMEEIKKLNKKRRNQENEYG